MKFVCKCLFHSSRYPKKKKNKIKETKLQIKKFREDLR